MSLAKFALVLLFAVSSAQPYAAEKLVVLGVGMLSCGKFLAMRQTKDQQSLMVVGSWMQGYLSGANYPGGAQARSLPDYESMLAYTDKYCRDNPLHLVLQASMTLYGELPPAR